MINLKNICKVYGDGDSAVSALSNVSLEIADGSFVAVVGKSGSGKTTLLNILGGLDGATAGEIIVDGISLNRLTSDELADYRNKKTGFVFQSYYLEPTFTVLENVEMPLIIAGVEKSERRERAQKWIVKLGLSDKINVKTSNLSGGQKQRVSIARALVNDPTILLADEPTGNLDTKNGNEVMELLREINAGGVTVILITHNDEYAHLADYAIILEDGRVKNLPVIKE